VHVESTTLRARARRRLELSPATFRRLAVAAALWLWLIVLTGATVRLTSSGLGCEHWPGCTAGNPFPSKSYHSFIEFGNRVVSFLTIVATLVAWIGARYTPGLPRWVRRLALATFVGTLAQAPLGAITVYAGLNPWLVMSHFLLALLVLGAGVVVAVEAFSFERGHADERLPSIVRTGAFVGAASLLALILSGMISTAAGPHPGSADVERLWRLHAALYVHVRATAIFAVLFVSFVVWVVRNRARWPLYAEGAGALLFLLLVQMGIGELQYRTHLPWWLVLIHVALAAGVWGSAVALVTAIQRPPKPFEPGAPTLPR
jgi:cytochrome c oxidase assembly protein subunit 15